MKHEIFGFKFNEINKKSTEVFDIVEVCEETFYITKETFHHEEEGLTFDYKLALVCIPTELYTNDCPEGSCDYELMLIPTASSLHKDKLNDILKYIGFLEYIGCDLDNVVLDNLITDIYFYGLAIRFGYAHINGEHSTEDIADKTANIIDCANSVRGFFLDKPWNAIGTNGWNTLETAINNKPLFG